ncbi:MAG: glycosyltransferase family 2 protein [Anaerolineales bacterium]|nr:glycosyltransferase family 2 protein [Anaerolineales bacterium]
MQISIIIVVHNHRKDLERCLHSLNEHSLEDTEIIVVDNASTDGSHEMVKSKFPDVIYLHCDENLGFGHGNNHGASHARGDYLIFLNPDTVVTQNWQKPLISTLIDHSQIGLTTPKILHFDETSSISACGLQIHLTGIGQCRGVGKQNQLFTQQEEVGAIHGAAFAIKKEVFEKIGGFDAPFFLYVEDSDISWRARLAGYRCVYVPDSVVYHDYSLRFSPQKLFYLERNRYLLLTKNLHWGTLFILLPALMLMELIGWGFVFLKDRKNWKNKALAYAWMIQNWNEVLQKRWQVQQLRRITDRKLLSFSTHRLIYEQVKSPALNHLAHWVLDPIFWVLKGLVSALVWW